MKDILYRIFIYPIKSFFDRIVEFLPNLLSSIIIVALGFLIALVVRKVLVKLLDIINADKFCQRVGLTDSLKKGGLRDKPSVLISKAVFWLIVVSFGTMSLYALRLPAIEDLLERFFLYLPNIFVAVVIVVAGVLLGNFFSRATLIASVNAGIRYSSLISRGVKTGILILATTMALEQLGIGKDTVIVAFTILFGGFVFALSLAFGLAGKDIAEEYLRKRLTEEGKKKNDIQHL